MMKKATLFVCLASIQIGSADILSSTNRFFGMGGQYPSYSEEGEEVVPSALDQAPYSPADSDLGVQNILVEQPERFPVILDMRAGFFYTDQAPAPAGSPTDPSWLFSLNAEVAYRPHLVSGWFGDFGLSYDYVRFEDVRALDYENLNLRIGVFKNLPDLDDTIVFGRYEYQMVSITSLFEDDYDASRFRIGLQKSIWSAPRHSLVATMSYAYEFDASPSSLERDEISLNLAYRFSITDAVYVQTTGRVYRFDYDKFGREDWTYTAGVELVWQINQNIRAFSSVYYDKNDSNQRFGVGDIESWTGGLGMGMEWTF